MPFESLAPHRLVRLWVRIISRIVPRPERSLWLEEWLGELHYGVRAGGRLTGSVLGLARGTLRDALAVRFPGRLEDLAPARARLGSGVPLVVRLALRALRSAPGTTAAAIVMLSLGIGAAVAAFAVVDAVLVRPLPYEHSARLVNLWQRAPDGLEAEQLLMSPPHAAMVLEESGVFERIALSQAGEWVLSIAGAPATLNSLRVNSSFLDLFGGRPALGRLFTAEDDRRGAPVVAVLTHALWRDRFGSDPHIIGKTVPVNYTGRAPVIGVLPRGFELDYGLLGRSELRGAQVDAFFSLPQANLDDPRQWNGDVFNAVGLLREGVGLDQAQAAVDGLEAGMTAARATAFPEKGRVGTLLVPVLEQMVGRTRASLLLLFVAIGFLLLLACANCANLLLGRGGLRGKEAGVHAALGAGRAHLVSRFLAEAALIASASAIIGLVLAALAIQAVEVLGAQISLPRLREIAIDGRVYAAAAGLALFAALASGLVPAIRLSRVGLNVTLKDTGHRPMGAGLRRRLDVPSALVVLEVAVSVTLLVGTVLVVRSFMAINAVEPGFERYNTASFRVEIPYEPYRQGRAPYLAKAALQQQIKDRLEAMPGVEHAAHGSDVPFDFRGGPYLATLVGRDDRGPVPVDLEYPGLGFFQVMGIPVVDGRAFLSTDYARGAATSAIVDESLARRFSDRADAVGQWIDFGWEAPLEIVGVVANVHDMSLEGTPGMKVYVAASELDTNARFGYWVVRTTTDPADVAKRVRDEIHAIDPNILVADLQTTEQRLAGTLAVRRVSTLLLQVLGALGAILALVGVHAVVSDRVGQARHEIGVRIAVGASAADVIRTVLWYSTGLAVAGALLGLLLASGLARLLGSLLFGVDPLDPVTYLASALVLVLCAAVAALRPARSAARVDPAIVLRQI